MEFLSPPRGLSHGRGVGQSVAFAEPFIKPVDVLDDETVRRLVARVIPFLRVVPLQMKFYAS